MGQKPREVGQTGTLAQTARLLLRGDGLARVPERRFSDPPSDLQRLDVAAGVFATERDAGGWRRVSAINVAPLASWYCLLRTAEKWWSSGRMGRKRVFHPKRREFRRREVRIGRQTGQQGRPGGHERRREQSAGRAPEPWRGTAARRCCATRWTGRSGERWTWRALVAVREPRAGVAPTCRRRRSRRKRTRGVRRRRQASRHPRASRSDRRTRARPPCGCPGARSRRGARRSAATSAPCR